MQEMRWRPARRWLRRKPRSGASLHTYDVRALALDQLFLRQIERLPVFRRKQHTRDVRLADDVGLRIRAQIRGGALRHVVDVAHVVLETGNAPPEPELV